MHRLLLALLALIAILIVSGCGSPSTPAPANAAPTAKPAQAGAAKSAPNPSSPAIDGIRLTVDGQMVDLPGDVKVSRASGGGAGRLLIGKNPSPSALVGGNGVLLELQTAPGKDGFQEGFSATDVAIVTFTVWKGVDFSYVSMGTIPGQSVKGLVLSQTSGKLAGSFEADLNGTLGKMHARVDFGVAFPK